MSKDFNFNKVHIIPFIHSTQPNTAEIIWFIPPTNYLLGVAINPATNAELKCVIQSANGTNIMDTEFYMPYGLLSGGILFKEPLRNYMSRSEYRLKITKYMKSSPPIPNVTIYPIGCW